MTATMTVYKTVHDTVNVIIQNYSSEVATVLWRFDIWNSNGHCKYNGNPKELLETWFECPMEFLDFINSPMGREAFKRMGVERFNITT